ncbi:MAG TPA: RNA polymerase sigma factor [Actinophytocola sp.]|nr:RNA polymerase sigma factor [Actinophytocola sp.]
MTARLTDTDETALVTDEQLVARLRAGDQEAMGEVFDRYADRVYNFCFRRTASWSVAEDAMAAAFLEVWRIRDRATTYDGELLPWVYTVANNVCRNTMRSHRRQAQLRAKLRHVDAVAGGDHANSVADRVDEERRMALLIHALGKLGRRDREVLMLIAWDGLSYEQTAERLGVPIGTVRSRLSRARGRLTGLMAPQDDERNY